MMRRYASLLLTLAPLCRAAADPPPPTPEERQQLLTLLEDSRTKLRTAVAGLTPPQWTYLPAPDRWSVGLVTEHIMRTEGALWKKVEEAMANPINPEWEKKTQGKSEMIARALPSRQTKVDAPVELRPEGKLSREEIMSQFEKLREQIHQFARDTDKPIRAHTAEHPMAAFGTLSAYQWMLYIAYHTERHLKQIEEVKASPGYPRN